MTDEVMFEIAQMTGQEYVHRYTGESEAEPVVEARVASVSELPDPAPAEDDVDELRMAAAAG